MSKTTVEVERDAAISLAGKLFTALVEARKWGYMWRNIAIILFVALIVSLFL